MVRLYLTLSTEFCLALDAGNCVDTTVFCLSFGHFLAISVFGLIIDQSLNQFELCRAKRACSHADIVVDKLHRLCNIELIIFLAIKEAASFVDWEFSSAFGAIYGLV